MSEQADVKVPVTMRALVQRISRKLMADAAERWKAKIDEVGPVKFCASRGLREREAMGEYYVVGDGHNHNMVTHMHLDPETFGRKLGVLRPYEEVVPDDAWE